MNLITYFKYYYKLTEGRILSFILMSLIAVVSQIFALACLASVSKLSNIDGVANNFVTQFMFEILNYAGIAKEENQFITLMILSLLSFCFSCAVFVLAIYYTSVIQSNVYVNLQRKFAKKLLNVDYQFFMTNNIGFLNNVITMQIRQLSQSFKFYTTIITNTLLGGAYLMVPLIINIKSVIMMGIGGIPLIGIMFYINRKTKQFSVETVDQQSDLNGILFQMVSNFKYLKSTETYPAVLKKHIQFSGRLAKLMRKLALMGALNEHGILAYTFALSIFIVGWLYLKEGVSLTNSVIALALIAGAARKLSTIPSAYQKFLGVSGAILVCRKLEDDLNAHQETDHLNGKEKPDFSSKLTFKNVSFQYANNEEKVLHNINLDIEPNTSVAFVGMSGSGKSTLVNMVSGLLVPTAGEITLGGKAYKHLSMTELRSAIGYVTQEPVIFSDTVLNNIRLWKDDISQSQVEGIAQKAHAADFIESFPKQYNTLLGDNGLNVSGGQRQRITIARELLRDAHILVLDEATSALDTETEKNIQQSIEDCHGKRTLIIIAHRLSTIKNCDKIFVLDNGAIIEEGTYEELYSKGGKFSSMVDSQNME